MKTQLTTRSLYQPFNTAAKMNGPLLRIGICKRRLTTCNSLEKKLSHVRLETPVSRERYIPNLRVIGQIPESLIGTYLRNGPNFEKPSKDQHFFGEGMIHSITLHKNSTPSYQSKKIVAEPHWPSPYPDYPNVSVVKSESRIFAAGDVGNPREILLSSSPLSSDHKYTMIDDLGVNNFQGKLEGSNFSAHAKVLSNGKMIFPSCTYHKEPYLKLVTSNSFGSNLKQRVINFDKPTMIHDFSVTENFSIIVDHPVKFQLIEAVKSLVQGKILSLGNKVAFRWDEEHQTSIHLIPHDPTASAQKISCENFACFHHVNAFESGDSIYLDLVRYDSLFKTGPLDFGNPSYLTRFEIKQAEGVVDQVFSTSHSVEMPVINPQYMGKEYQHCYGLLKGNIDSDPLSLKLGYAPGLVKHTMELGESTVSETFNAGDLGYGLGEFTFVPDSFSYHSQEDSGHLIGFALHLKSKQSELWVFDAQDIEQGPVAAVETGIHIPHGFHGDFV